MEKQEETKHLLTMQKNLCLLALVLLFTIIVVQPIKALAAGIEITDIDYDTSTLTIKVNGDQKVFFSDSKMKKWEELIGTPKSNIMKMDISWITTSKDYVLTLKGDVCTDVVSVTIPKQKTDLKLTYDKLTGLLETKNLTANTTLYWRKSVSSIWHPLSANSEGKYNLKPEVEGFLMKGAKLYFKTAQVKGTSASSPGTRPSKEILLSIPKRGTAPSVSIDGSKLSIGVKSTYVYKRVGIDSDWKDIPVGTTILKLSELASDSMATESANGTKVIPIMFRTKATKSAVESNTKLVKVPIQEKAPTNVTVTYPNATSFVFNVKEKGTGAQKEEAPSTTVPYEYTIVTPTEQAKMQVNGTYQLDYTKVNWTAITSDKDITITSSKAPRDSILYVRKKTLSEISTGTNKRDFSLASYPNTKKIDGYPNASEIVNKNIIKFKGQPLSDATFTVTVDAGINTDIDTIKCNGTELKFTQTKTGNTITVTLTSVADYEEKEVNLNKENKLIITLKNGEVVSMTEDKQISLTIKEAVKVTDASVTKYRGDSTFNSVKDDLAFGFTLVENSLKSNSNNIIDSIFLGSEDLGNNYITEVSGDKVTVTLQYNSSVQSVIDKLGIGKHNLTVTLTDGTAGGLVVVLEEVTLTLKEIAKLEGSVNITKTAGTDWTKELNFVLTLEEEYKSVSLDCVTWNGKIIDCNSETKNGVMTIIIPKDKVNTIEADSTVTFNKAFPVVLHFSNKAAIKAGTLQINKKTTP